MRTIVRLMLTTANQINNLLPAISCRSTLKMKKPAYVLLKKNLCGLRIFFIPILLRAQHKTGRGYQL
jgi:hypothetical protein